MRCHHRRRRRVAALQRSVRHGKQRHLLTINRAVRKLLLITNRSFVNLLLEPKSDEESGMPPRGEVLQGTLDLIVLKTLDAMGPLHGYGIAMRIQQVSEDLVKLNQGTLYPALLRLEQRGWISSKWGVSENNRKAKYYSLTKSGRKQLVAETESWERMASVIGRLIAGAEES
jgi:PadR family transcriptional regulator, regulatory protein PadR